MSEPFSPPSIDPADEDNLAGVLRAVMGKFLQGVDDCLPAVVIAYDRASNRATVQPQIMMGATDGQKVSRAQIASVPVLNIGGGGFVLSFPIKPGDLGWIKASDRDVSLFFQGDHQEEWPNTKRMHSFQDGLFIPDVMRQWTLAGEDAECAVLQSTDGTTRISVGAGRVKITAPLVEIDAPNSHFTGDVQVDGTLTADVDVIAAGKSGASHTHGGVQAGSASTGAPQ